MTTRDVPVEVERVLLSLCADGARAAAEALARLLDAEASPVEGPVRVSAVELEQRLGPDVMAVGFRLSGGFEGALLHVLSPGDADALLARLPERLRAHAREERAQGALAELGNIAASAFLNAVAARVRRACVPSVPRYVDGGLRGALGNVDVDPEAGGLLLVYASVRIEGIPPVTLTLVVVPEPVSVAALAERVEPV